jgi:dienelactone hydrolase
LEPHGGELGGFILLRGDQDKLARIRSSDEFQRHITRGLLTVEHIGVVGASLGGQITAVMSLYAEQLEQLT